MSETILEDILHLVYLAGWNDKLLDKSATYVPEENRVKQHTKQAILRWVADEVIGRYENNVRGDGRITASHRNELRYEQRKILAQHGYKGANDERE